MLFYDDEDITQNIQDVSNGKWNFKLSIQRFLQLNEDCKVSNIPEDSEKIILYDELKKEGENIITYVNKVLNKAKSDCIPKKITTENNSNEVSEESSLEDSESLGDTNEDASNINRTYLDIINDKGLYNSSEDEGESNSNADLSVSSGDSTIDDDNLIPCTNDGMPDFSESINGFNKKRRRLSSSSSLEETGPVRKHYKLYESDEDIRSDSENNDKTKEDSSKGNHTSNDIETIVLSSDDEIENNTKVVNKYQRKILKNNQLAQSTREAKKLNDIYRKEYSQRQENKDIIIYHKGHNDKPYFERQIKSITLENDNENKVVVDKAFVKVLKPHQAEGIDFLFFSTIRSLKHIDDPGNGGILAHCMGLGKSLQVIVYLQTIFFNSKISENISKGLLLVPTNVINNWQVECEFWQSLLEDKTKKFSVYALVAEKGSVDIHENYLSTIERWVNSSRPSIIIVGYEMFRNLVTFGSSKRIKINSKRQKYLNSKYCEYLQQCPDIVICDEAHKLKNTNSKLTYAVSDIATRRRICLTGTPIQNNLREYFTMINFVRPNLLGTYNEFRNQFVNPIEKGIKQGATCHDVKLMKRRYAVLWKLLDHVLHRKDASFLYSTLPPKEEYIIYCATTPIQIKLLKDLVEKFSLNNKCLQVKATMSYICTHPSILQKFSLNNINDEFWESENNSDSENIDKQINLTEWYKNNYFLKDIRWNDFELSSKIIILFEILKYAEKVGDKVLVFVQYRETINYIVKSLQYLAENNLWYDDSHNFSQKGIKRTWKLYRDYFIITGDTSLHERSFIETRINMREKKSARPRLVLMTTKASALGTNFIGANRVVIFESGYNPSDDVQALHRVYRIGQKKPSFIYRLVAQGTIEERVQERQIIKEGISRCSIDKHNIRGLYNDEESRWNKLNCIDVNNPLFCRETLPKPNDDLLSSLIIKHPEKIINYAAYDSLLENKVDEGLTEEEKEKEWNDYIEEQKRNEDGEFRTSYASLSVPFNIQPTTNKNTNTTTTTTNIPLMNQILSAIASRIS